MRLSVPSFLATKNAEVSFSNGTDENGQLVYTNTIDIHCRNESCDETVYLPDGKKMNVTEKLFIFEKLELFPEKIEGTCNLEGHMYNILKGSKKRNPDGTINHIVLELV